MDTLASKQAKNLQPPSEEFQSAFGGYGSIVIDCGFCGRTYYEAHNKYDFEEGEFEEFEAKHLAEPDKYIPCDNGSYGYLNGKQYVHGCECNEARAFEDFIWNHRVGIAAYLAARSKAELKEAIRNDHMAHAVSAAVGKA
jgi:hypothetical protein